MNVLTDVLPSAFEIDGVVYPIKTDHRTAVHIMTIFEDSSLMQHEKICLMLDLLFDGNIPSNIVKASELSFRFLNCGESSSEKAADMQNEQAFYSFSKDCELIFSAFSQTYKIDLEKETLHWWKFCALFRDLNSECFFCQILHLRNAKRSGKMTPEEREQYIKLKDVIDMDCDSIDDDENAKEFLSLLRGE